MEQTHDKCKYYSYKKCPHIEDDIMIRANQETPNYYGGEIQQMFSFPTEEEINKLCGNCPAFTQK
jgi:hypothetical protein